MRDDGTRQSYWRSRKNQHDGDGWTFDLLACKSYRGPADARRAAQQICTDPGARVEVVEVESVVTRVHYRIEVHALVGLNGTELG